MNTPDYNSPSALKEYLIERGLGMQKKFGQNFLINSTARAKLLEALDLRSSMTVWEVGPGLGAETSLILQKGCNLTAFEIDRGFVAALNGIFADEKGFSLIEGDVLKTWYPAFTSANTPPDRFFGNLPYNISAVLLGNFIEKGLRFEKAVVTVQKEVAQRMIAKAGTADYSSFSVLCQWAYDIKTLVDLGPSSFWPQPHVTSRAVTMIRRDEFPCCTDPSLFMAMQRALFACRRKTIKNNLESFLNSIGLGDAVSEVAATALAQCHIAPNVRAETLTIPVLLALSDALAGLLITWRASASD